MTKDFADFLGSLNNEGVAYVVIGGIAVLAHVPYRTTSFAGVDELIRMKRATGNVEKDLPDVQRLEALRKPPS